MTTNEQVLDYVEEMFQKYGAKPVEGDAKADMLGLRPSFLRNGLYYRAETAAFEEGEIIVISATDSPKYAKLGLEDNIAGFPVTYPKEKIEKEIRFAFDIEPYPENYPDY